MPPEAIHPGKILILPFKDMSQVRGENIDARCPVCGRVFLTGKVPDGASDILTEKLVSWLQNHTNHNIIVSTYTHDSQSLYLSASSGELVVRKILAEIGRKSQVDTVLAGFLYRFRERVGKGYSIESPASVAFSLHLIRVSDGNPIWSAHYDETQQSLGENLFQLGSFISRGGRWITAEEMAVSGLDELLSNFPKS